ncbi:VOC family protein [Lentzea sp. NPDC051208]|uniref:VOC family protein n=1 Tax=Lentzea sp. NPDC051208 TaxID=3154642 RepID=UPI003419A025
MSGDAQSVAHQDVTAYLTVSNAQRSLAFYEAAFGAEIMEVVSLSDGTTTHAEVRIGKTVLYLHDELPGARGRSPRGLGGTTTTFALRTDDVDLSFARAVAAGAAADSGPSEGYWGERYARVTDPDGHGWTFTSRTRHVTLDEQSKQASAHFSRVDVTAETR